MIGVNASEDTVFCSVEYDLDTFQTEKTGWKQLLRQISPPEGIGIEEGLQAYSYPYYVMDPQKIDLSYFSLCSDGSYFFEWLYEVNDPENFFLEYAVNGGVWNSVAADSPDNICFVLRNNQMFLLASRQWRPGNTYDYRVRYRGETSNWVEFAVTGEGCTSTLHDGDRDEQVIPDASQPGGSFAASQPVKQPKGESGQEEIPASAVQDGARRGIP